jgi:hypothetical protein
MNPKELSKGNTRGLRRKADRPTGKKLKPQKKKGIFKIQLWKKKKSSIIV